MHILKTSDLYSPIVGRTRVFQFKGVVHYTYVGLSGESSRVHERILATYSSKTGSLSVETCSNTYVVFVEKGLVLPVLVESTIRLVLRMEIPKQLQADRARMDRCYLPSTIHKALPISPRRLRKKYDELTKGVWNAWRSLMGHGRSQL